MKSFYNHLKKTNLLSVAKVSTTTSYPNTYQGTPLRHYSFMRNCRNLKNSHLLTRNNDRGLFTEAAWGLACVATGNRVWDNLLGNDRCYDYTHPWLYSIGLASLITWIAAVKHSHDKDAKCINSIFDAKESSDKNALSDFFKHQLSNDNNTSKNLFNLVNNAIKTETLEVLLENVKELDQEQIKKLFNAVKQHGTINQCNEFLNMAKFKGVSVVANTPAMRPGR